MYYCEFCRDFKDYDSFHEKPKFIKGKRICITCHDIARPKPKNPAGSRKRYHDCVECGNKLLGRQMKYCSVKCKDHDRTPETPCLKCGNLTRNKYCSSECRTMYYSESKKADLSEIPCSHCETEFLPKTSRQIFCSAECRKLSANETRRRVPIDKNCLICGEPSGRRKVCSSACGHRLYRKPPEVRCLDCLFCGDTFETTHSTQKYCSRKCSRKAYDTSERGIRNRREEGRRRYQKYKNTPEYREKKNVYRKKYRSKRKKRVRRSCPSWVSAEELCSIYDNRPDGCHVDHIIPICNELVCGLHVPINLQYLPEKDNEYKSNKFDGTYENEGWRSE